MNEIKLNAQTRSKKYDKAKKIRATGFVPAVIYGNAKQNHNLKIRQLDFERVFKIAGESNLIDLIINKEEKNPIKVIVKDIQKNIIKNNITHIDFYQVDMDKKIKVEIPLNFVGEAKAIKKLGGTLIKNMENVRIECLPGNLVNQINVDLTVLKNFTDSIKVKNLPLPTKIKIMNQPEDMIVHAVKARVEKELTEAEKTEEKTGEKDEKEPSSASADTASAAKADDAKKVLAGKKVTGDEKTKNENKAKK